MRIPVAAIAMSLSIVGMSLAQEPPAAVRRATNIPPQSLSQALGQLAKERGLALAYRSEVIGDRRSEGVVGNLTTDEAFTRILSGTGLTYRYLDEKTLTIVAATPIRAADAGGSQAGRRRQAAARTIPSADSTSSKVGLPEVIIEANREALERRVRAFVAKLTHSRRFPDSGQPAPRWVQPLCFAVAGLPREYSEFVAARLAQIAASVGADVRKECSRREANFEVVFTPDPAETLQYLDRHPLLLQDHHETGLALIERFLRPPKSVVVRVWHNTEFLNRAGDACGFSLIYGGVISCGGTGSRITLSGVPGFARTIVVIDSTRIEGFQLEQISSYVAFAGLVDLDDDVNLGDTPSILRLFTDPPEQRAQGLTDWDLAFLNALYNTDWRNAQQRMQIGDKMVNEIGH